MLKIAYSPEYHHPLPPGHRFPMEKYSLLPQQLLHEGTVSMENFFRPRPLRAEEICAVHHPHYLEKLLALDFGRQEERRSGFPISRALVEREFIICGGSLQNTDYALQYGVSMNIAGGTHHAYADRAEGFCLLNDIAIGSAALLRNYPHWQIMVVDLDVHQGNGTAAIFAEEKRVFTFSMHGKNNYPLKKEHSDLDVALDDGTQDDEYLALMDQYLMPALDKVKPQFIFFQSGVDVLKTDKLGRLGLSMEGCRERDRKLLEYCRHHQIPLAISMGGGYSEKISHIIEAHSNTFRLVRELWF